MVVLITRDYLAVFEEIEYPQEDILGESITGPPIKYF